MENTTFKDTITAISTPAGEGGIAVIRISGKDALNFSASILSYRGILKDRMIKIAVLNTGTVQDEVLLLYFKSPHSFTGEDVLEIQCHGNYFLAKRIAEALIKNGCRAAEPGEFTRRAFLNGRIDLTKAEGILDLICAKSESALVAAYAQVKGEVFSAIDALQKQIITLVANASAAIDYPEEYLSEVTNLELFAAVKPIKKELIALKDSFDSGVLIREGVRVVIVGLPNVGKSLLMNRLLGHDRAIVTDEAGTTRDTVEESFLYRGVRFILTDTAGIREAASEAEKQGIERSVRAAEEANLILAVAEADKEFILPLPNSKPVLFVKNKTDLFSVKKGTEDNAVNISALTQHNIETLKEEIYARTVGKISASGVSINNLRQFTAVLKTLEALDRIVQSSQISLDCVLSDLNEAYRALGTVTGITATDSIINAIFSNFCVGK